MSPDREEEKTVEILALSCGVRCEEGESESKGVTTRESSKARRQEDILPTIQTLLF